MKYFSTKKVKSRLLLLTFISFTFSIVSTTAATATTIDKMEHKEISIASQLANKVTIDVINTSIRDVAYIIQQQAKVNIIIEDANIDKLPKIDFKVSDLSASEALDKLLKNTSYEYRINNNNVAIVKSLISKNTQQDNKISVTGKVVDENGDPIAAAAVIIEGTATGAITDSNGKFSFVVTKGAKINVSYAGYIEQTIIVNNRDITIKLAVDEMALDDVVVTGFQKISKERATGSYDIISQEKLDRPTSSLQESIVGSIAGIQMIDYGWNSDEQTMIIRGLTSLGSNAKPLIVVDGFAIEGNLASLNPNDIASISILKDAAAASIWGARSANGVVVITTKKSKKGKLEVELNSHLKFSSKIDLDYANPLASSAETIEYETLGYSTNFFNKGTPLSDAYSSSIYNGYGDRYSTAVVAMNEAKLGYMTDSELKSELARLSGLDNTQQIKDNILNAPVSQQYNLSIKGGTDRMSNVFTVLYDKQSTTFKDNSDKRYTFNYRTNVNIYNWLDLEVSSMYQYSQSNSNGMSLSTIQAMSPYEMLLDDNGNYLHVQDNIYLPIVDRYITNSGVEFPYSDWSYNPLQNMLGTSSVSKSTHARIQAGLNFKIMKGLTFNTKFQYELLNSSNETLYDESTYTVRMDVNYTTKWDGNPDTAPTAWNATGYAIDKGGSETDAWNFRNQLNFDRTFNDRHQITAIAGIEASKSFYLSQDYPITYGYDPNLYITTTPPGGVVTALNPQYTMFGTTNYSGGSFPSINYSDYLDKYFSMYFNASYTLDNKYTLSASARNDASNLISSDPTVKYSPFWSIGGSWQMQKEKFMEKYDMINRLVLRATYGYNGNVDKSTSVDPLISVWSTSAYTGTNSGIISNYGNPYLSWERTGSLNIGIDYSIFDNKLFGKIDYYNKQGRDLISTVAISNVYGSDNQEFNAVSMYNKGIEFTVGTTIRSKQFIWGANLAFAYNKNRITELYKDSATLAYRVYGPTSGWEYAEGYDASTLWQFMYGGVQEIGGVTQPVIVDKNGENARTMTTYNTSFDSSDYLTSAGSGTAPYTVGFNGDVEYKNFRLSCIVSGYFGHKYKRTGFNYPTMSYGVGDINIYYDEVKNGNPNEIIPLPSESSNWTYPSYQSSYAGIIDYLYVTAANIRFQEVNLSYNLSRSAINKIGLSAMSVYVQANNIGTIVFNGYGEDPMYPMGTIKPNTAFILGTKINF